MYSLDSMNRRDVLTLGSGALLGLNNLTKTPPQEFLTKELVKLGMNGLQVFNLSGTFKIISPSRGRFVVAHNLVSTLNQPQIKQVSGENHVLVNIPNTTGEFGLLSTDLGRVADVTKQLFDQQRQQKIIASYCFADGPSNNLMYDHKILNGLLMSIRMSRYGVNHPILPGSTFSYLNDFVADEVGAAALMGYGLHTNRSGGRERVLMQAGGICMTGSLLYKLAKQAEYLQKLHKVSHITSQGSRHGGNWDYYKNATDPTGAGFFDATVAYEGRDKNNVLRGKDLIIAFPKGGETLFLHTQVILDPVTEPTRAYNPLIHCTSDIMIQVSFRTYPMILEDMSKNIIQLYDFIAKRPGLTVPKTYLTFIENEFNLASIGN
jgi:hypothetical protein